MGPDGRPRRDHYIILLNVQDFCRLCTVTILLSGDDGMPFDHRVGMKRPFHSFWVLVGIAALVWTSCGRTERNATSSKGALEAKRVRVAQVTSRPMEKIITLTGTLAAREQTTISSKVAGRLQQVAVDMGSLVRQGDLLAQIEPRDYELKVQQASAAVSQARADLGLPLEGDNDHVEIDAVNAVKQAAAVLDEAAQNRDRVLSLVKAGIATQSESETVDSAYKVAVARLETAREEARTRMGALSQRRAEYEIAVKQLSDSAIRAPFDGTIQERLANTGQYAAVGTAIVTLVKAEPLRLRLEIPERESPLVCTNQLVRLSVEGYTNEFQGRLARLSPALDDATRTLRVEADVPGQGLLRPGLFARARIVVSAQEPVLCVPLNGLVTFAGIEKVVLVRDGKALETTVTTGRREDGWCEIVEGVSPQDQFVLDAMGLRTGQPVVVESVPDTRK